MNSKLKDVNFWLAILIFILTFYLSIGTYLDWFDFGFVVGQYRFNHWLSWTGFLFILFYVPIFVTLKRRFTSKIRLFFGIHVLGNLIAFMLITIHFVSQISRPSQFYPDLGTGLALFVFMIILVTTGFLQRFNIINSYRKNLRFLHTSSVVALFVIIFIHILHGVQLL